MPEDIHVLETIDQPGGAFKAEQVLTGAREQNPKTTLFDEATVNFIGYEHMQARDLKGAIQILKSERDGIPKLANVCDSLSDACVADGQQQPAQENARKGSAIGGFRHCG